MVPSSPRALYREHSSLAQPPGTADLGPFSGAYTWTPDYPTGVQLYCTAVDPLALEGS
jgi:hypothetical protein